MPFNSLKSDISLTLHGQTNHRETRDRPTILLIHGAGMDHSVWSEQITPLTKAGFQVATLDLPEHGKSRGKTADTIADMAKDVLHIVEGAGLTNILMVGHSMGGLVALTAAATGNKNISALCLCGVSSRMPVHPTLLQLAQANHREAAKMIAKWCYGSTLSAEQKQTRMEATINLLENAKDGVLGKDMLACNNFNNARELAAKIDLPVLLVLGEEDKMTPPEGGAKLQAMLQNPHKVILPKAGHMMMQETADGFNAALTAFVAHPP